MTDKKNILIGALIFAICVMAVGYAAFATTLTITGTATISNDWDVEITNIEFVASTDSSEPYKSAGEAANGATGPSHTMTTATFASTLYQPGDSAVYKITIENKGTTAAVLNNTPSVPSFVTNTESTNHDYNVIKWEILQQPDTNLAASGTTYMYVRVYYDSSITDTEWNNDQTAAGISAITETATVTVEYQQATGS